MLGCTNLRGGENFEIIKKNAKYKTKKIMNDKTATIMGNIKQQQQ